MLKISLLWLALAGPLLAQAQAQAQAQAPAASAPKKELVAKVLQLQQPGIEGLARTLVEQPVHQMMQQVGLMVQQRVPAEKREAMGQAIQGDVKKYLDEAFPIVRDSAVKLAPSTIGALLEEKFSEDELKQLVAILESPVQKKFQQLGGDMQRSLTEKLVAESRAAVQPKLAALEQAVAGRIGPPAKPASAASAAKKR